MNNHFTNTSEICPACNGAKIQVNKDGLRVLCPVCGGSGYYRPWYTPIYESVTVTIKPNTDYWVYQNDNRYSNTMSR